ncbi:hypothetical protein JW796_01490 [Candidatus Dojkabacteria bacterium]|nr:hypothetical protein [Candidatus Dojkabacteria bacterium]
MKIAIIGPKVTNKWDKIYKQLKDILSQSGNVVDFSYFDTSTVDDAENLEGSYKKNQRLIKNADVIVAETTDFSSGIGYLIAKALNDKKPVLALYNKALGDKPSNIIKASSLSKLLTFNEYTEEGLSQSVKKFLNKVRKILDTKFILIISPQIDRYLEWAADFRRMHKAQIVRNAIEEMMGKDTEYKKKEKEQ